MWSNSPPSRRRRRTALRPAAETLESRWLLSAGGMISGLVVEDLTGDGPTADDVPVAGRTVHLYRDDGDGEFDPTTDALLGSQPTASDGRYQFAHLGPGTYFVQPELPGGW